LEDKTVFDAEFQMFQWHSIFDFNFRRQLFHLIN